MTTKSKVLIIAAVFVTGGAFGRFTTPTKTVTVKETLDVSKEKKNVLAEASRDKHTETTIVEETQPSGAKKVTTKIIETNNVDKKTDTKSIVQDSKLALDTKEVTKQGGIVGLHALAGYDLSKGPSATGLVFGVHLTAGILGPISIGAFGFTNSMLGLSVGLTF